MQSAPIPVFVRLDRAALARFEVMTNDPAEARAAVEDHLKKEGFAPYSAVLAVLNGGRKQ
ncbi:MAG: hypothetical protein EOP24_26625 [Hyphomicrobiales bacterium]|nr:MAG: hypothetical protein EOP24_26625 [Hyphomicrobiales bacterium]